MILRENHAGEKSTFFIPSPEMKTEKVKLPLNYWHRMRVVYEMLLLNLSINAKENIIRTIIDFLDLKYNEL